MTLEKDEIMIKRRFPYEAVGMTKRIFSVCLLVFLTLSIKAQEQKNHRFEVAKNLDLFNNIYKNLDLMYVDTLVPGEVIGTGIRAMLSGLDPYTEYYPESETKNLKMMITGKYAGIGAIVRYHQRLKRVVIDEPYADMPAAMVGVKKGDIILSVDDTLMTDKDVSYVSSHLRGDPGTSFVLKVKRPTTGKEMKFKITRKNIKLAELPYYGMRQGNIGYINLNQFTEGCAKEVRRAFVDLKKRGDTVQAKYLQQRTDSFHLVYKNYTRQLAKNLKEGVLHSFLQELYPLTYKRQYPDGRIVTINADTNEEIPE